MGAKHVAFAHRRGCGRLQQVLVHKCMGKRRSVETSTREGYTWSKYSYKKKKRPPQVPDVFPSLQNPPLVDLQAVWLVQAIYSTRQW